MYSPNNTKPTTSYRDRWRYRIKLHLLKTETCISSEKMSAKAVAYWNESCLNKGHTATEQYSDKAIWILTGTRWAKAENYVNELHWIWYTPTNALFYTIMY